MLQEQYTYNSLSTEHTAKQVVLYLKNRLGWYYIPFNFTSNNNRNEIIKSFNCGRQCLYGNSFT